MSLDPNDESRSFRLIDAAIDSGICFFDTADLYAYGEIETLLGKAIKGKRDRLIIATKGGNRWEKGKAGWHWDPSKKYLLSAVKASLKRLKTDYIDLYQLHGGTIEDPIDETIDALEEMKKEGWIREYGISSIRPNVIAEYVKRSNIVSVMMQYSLLDRRPEEEMLSFLKNNHISVIARGPVAKGLLSEKGNEKIPENGYLDYSRGELSETVAQLKKFAGQKRNLTQLALRYVLQHPAVTSVVFGASRLEQLQENIASLSAPPLDEKETEQLVKATKANLYEKHRRDN